MRKTHHPTRKRRNQCSKRRLLFEALEDRRLLAPVAGDRNPYDIDGDGTADPLSDGILVIRYLAGFTGDALMQGVVNSAGSRADEASIMARLATIEDSFLDPDGDVNNLPLSDGILIVRHLAGFDDDTLVSGAANLEQGIRRSPTTIQKYLDQPINEPPQGTTVPFGLNEDGQLDVLAADGLLKNVSDPDGDAIVAKLGTPAGNGTVEVQPNGSFSYIPNADFFGTDSFTFIASDEFGAEAELLVQIAVASVNDPPVVIEQAFETPNDNLL
ncbi:MAG: cadherin-like domain-containing protein, partial [Planctomycetia bacterium]|nr:cadherin-like domain-containing protein [Planctomycetia bacterium]